jgi:hypothetical protein
MMPKGSGKNGDGIANGGRSQPLGDLPHWFTPQQIKQLYPAGQPHFISNA